MQEDAAPPLKITVVRIAACLAIYLASQWLAFQLTIQPENISIFWPPAGVMLGRLLGANRRSWIILAPLFLVATAIANFLAGRGPDVNAALSLTDVAIALLGAWGYQARAIAQPLLESRKKFWLLLLVAGLSAIISATAGAATISIAFGAPYWSVLRLWARSMVLGIVLTTPAMLAWSDEAPPREPDRPWFSQGIAAVLVLTAAAFAYLSQFIAATAGGALIYVPLALLVWIALHGSGRETTLAILVTRTLRVRCWRRRSVQPGSSVADRRSYRLHGTAQPVSARDPPSLSSRDAPNFIRPRLDGPKGRGRLSLCRSHRRMTGGRRAASFCRDRRRRGRHRDRVAGRRDDLLGSVTRGQAVSPRGWHRDARQARPAAS